MVYKNRKTKRWIKKRKMRKPFSKRQVKAIKKLAVSTSETKSDDRFSLGVSIYDSTSGPRINSICNLPQGDEPDRRDGNKIILKGLSMMLNIRNPDCPSSTVIGADRRVRAVLFYFPSSGLPISGTFYNYYLNTGSTTFGVNQFHLRDSDVKYTILMDRIVCPNYINGGKSSITIKKYINLKGKEVHYNDTTANSVVKGSLCLCYYSDATVSTPAITESSMRLFYKDP